MKISPLQWLSTRLDLLGSKLENGILSNKLLKCRVVYGPSYSRRLGMVLGINNVKPGTCSYNCIYCPSGKTSLSSVCTDNCITPYTLYSSVKNKLNELAKAGREIDYILFYGSGDCCLDSCLSKEILLLREFGYKIAVFTNSALIWNKTIRENLMFADYVSAKIDTVNENTWLKINRPHQRLKYDHILNGIKQFADDYKGVFTTETTFIKNINDNADEVIELGKYFKTFSRSKSYFMTPIYPPLEGYAVSPEEGIMNMLSETVKNKIPDAVMLCCPEKLEFLPSDDFENELLGLLAFHPVSEQAVVQFAEANDQKETLLEMLSNPLIKQVEFNGRKFLTMNGVQ